MEAATVVVVRVGDLKLTSCALGSASSSLRKVHASADASTTHSPTQQINTCFCQLLSRPADKNTCFCQLCGVAFWTSRTPCAASFVPKGRTLLALP
eukprot:4115095-Pleurochrysis_carterae.AAC.2